MSAYFIAYVKAIVDPEAVSEYRRLGAPTYEEAGCIFRIRNGVCQTLEGETVQSVVMMEFPSMDAARAWYYSPRYQEALKCRLGAALTNTVLAEGV